MDTIRKLTAILSADVVGYSRLMGEDDNRTLERLVVYRDVMTRYITHHHGRVVDAPGDALLAEFPSAIEAVRCAVKCQRDLADRNAALTTNTRMDLRIGLNLGDVIERGGALFGDGVNIAARLQALADAGGVCISGTVFDQVEDKLPVAYQFLGEVAVKNIAKPVRAYHVQLNTIPTSGGSGSVAHIPVGPSIAVLPFANMSSDPEQDYFSDGLTEDIITELSRFHDLRVLARNTTFQYKSKPVDVTSIGHKLGVRYVLEGSVRKAGNQLRIVAQLIDVKTGGHVWANRYDRDLSAIFAVQDEIARKICAVVASAFGVIDQADLRAAKRKRPDQLLAYDYVLRATSDPFAFYSKAGYAAAKAQLEKAMALDPNYARAFHEYAWLLVAGWIFRFEEGLVPSGQIRELAIKSVQLDQSDPKAHRAAAWGYFFANELEAFEREVNIAIEQSPYDAALLCELGALMAFAGEWQRGEELVVRGYSLNAQSGTGWYQSTMYYSLYRQQRYREAIEVIREHPLQALVETQWKYVAAYAELGELERARSHWEECLKIDPGLTIERLVYVLVRLWNFPADFANRFRLSLEKAVLK